MAEKLLPEKRHAFVHNGQKVFEWDQTLEEVNVYIELSKGVPAKLFRCAIQSGHVEVGIRCNPPYLNHDLTLPVKTDSSFWTIEDGEMHITLQKREKGKTWSSPIQGQGILDPYAADQEQKRLMLQRFQEEAHSTFCTSFVEDLRTQGSTFRRLSSVEPALTQGASWEEYAPSEDSWLNSISSQTANV